MSTNFPDGESSSSDWVSQAEAARIHGVSRQAIHKLVQSGRLRSMRIGGHVLVNRQDVEQFHPRGAGRPTAIENRDFERVKALVDALDQDAQSKLLQYLRSKEPLHAMEARLGVSAEVILGALDRAGELTIRMFRGVIAEAAFDTYIVKQLPSWQSEVIGGNAPYDFRLIDPTGPVRVQVKLQRSEKGIPITRAGHYVVETQRTRGGKDKASGKLTRPYCFGEFDILAVCLQPSTGRWDSFRFTVGRWLQPKIGHFESIATYQPIPQHPNRDWTDDFAICVKWLRDGKTKTIEGDIGGRNDRGIAPSG